MVAPTSGCELDNQPVAAVPQRFEPGGDSGICSPASPVNRYL